MNVGIFITVAAWFLAITARICLSSLVFSLFDLGFRLFVCGVLDFIRIRQIMLLHGNIF